MAAQRTSRSDPSRRPQVAHHRGAPIHLPRHPGSPDPADATAVGAFLADRMRPTAIDMFCGAGGLSLGLDRAGFDVVVSADSDVWATRTHAANLAGLTWCGDLSDPSAFLSALRGWGIEHVDLVAGGVPCQPFSRAGGPRIRELVRAGLRPSHDERAELWSSFVAVVDRLRPRAVLVENVPDLPRWDDGAVLIGLFESLRMLGYTVDARVLDGFDHGVPQHRQRLFLIGVEQGRAVSWPLPTRAIVTLRDAIGDLPPIPRAQRTERLPYDECRIRSAFQRGMRDGLPAEERSMIRDHVCRDVRADDMEAFRLLREGQTYIDLPERLRRYRSDVFTDKYKRLEWDRLSRTITAHIAKDGYWYIHPEQHRTLSIREAARVQTFPDAFRFAGTQTHRYRQIGNAVPVALGQAVGGAVLAALAGRLRAGSVDGDEHVRSRLLAWHELEAPATASWRREGDPWLTLVGELALARSRRDDAERTIAAFARMAPTPEALASAAEPEERLLAMGFGARAPVIVEIARVLADGFAGEVPSDGDLLRMLPGVGDYVCNAVLCFAFGRRQVLVDAVTARIAGRLTGRERPQRHQLRLDLHRLAGREGPDARFNHALLDLGRDVCRGADPECDRCPLADGCASARRTPEGESRPMELAA